MDVLEVRYPEEVSMKGQRPCEVRKSEVATAAFDCEVAAEAVAVGQIRLVASPALYG